MAFAVAAAAVVALARMGTGLADPLNPRFVNWSATFWMGAVLAGASVARGTLGSALAVLVMVLSLSMLPAISDIRKTPMKWRNAATEASLGLLLGIPDLRIANRMYVLGKYERFHRALEGLKRDRRSFFAHPWAELPGAQLVERMVVVPSVRCRGDMRVTSPYGAPAARVARLKGVVEEASGKPAPSLVVVTDGAGIIRGLARVRDGSGRALPDFSGSAPGPFEWSGYLTDFNPSERYVAYAVLSDGRSACQLSASRKSR
jgi:hypothetical protein